ncbi:MAG: aminotransferase class III-fold pyridoxal phosphate-dependent enzyme [Chloroflexota bacterium]|nr:aminotransferase class III-fold pyridoxal phosphate-dependent enzyme [Chloroflexota bacterium]
MSASEPRRQRTAELVRQAEQIMPGACLGLFQLPLDRTIVMERGSGPYLWDVDGNQYIDYVLGSGPMILGHAHPAVVAAVQDQAAKGSTFYTLNEPIIDLSRQIVAAVPCGEAIKYVSTGTEATFHALRLARAFTGKSTVLKFEGGYHGAHDYAMVGTLASAADRQGWWQPDSAGIPRPVADTVLVSPFNDAAAARRLIARHAGELAAVIVEPLQRGIAPAPGFLQAIREATRQHGVLLIFDEVVTGFRLAYGGAQEYYGVQPDLATYGKAIGGGYPMAAVCGRRDVLALTDPSLRGSGSYAYLGGTLSGNPVAAVAGLATLAEMRRPGVYERLFATGNTLRQGIETLGRDLGLPVRAIGEGPVFQVFFTEREIRNHHDSREADAALAWAFGLELLDRGLFHTPGAKFYVSTVHGEPEVARTLEAVEGALRALRTRAGTTA